MARYKRSYVKTLVAATAFGVVMLLISHVRTPAGFGIVEVLVEVTTWSVVLITACVATGAIIALYRNQAQAKGRMDLFCAFNKPRSEGALATAHPGFGIRLRRMWRRLLGGQCLLVGDVVEIRSLDEIVQTLDASGCLNALPFMPEMARLCGQQARVYRCVDKIYDYGRSKTLRRLEDVVLLERLRCDGSAHGGCQASCYLLWQRSWLRPVVDGGSRRQRLEQHVPTAWRESTASSSRYICQYTQLAAASTPMRQWDIRQDLRPLLAGNVTLVAFCVAILTRLFNAVQSARGGVPYPAMMVSTGGSTRSVGHSLAPGDTVRVLPMEDIAKTLDQKGRNRGLWFDAEMVKHCGRRYTIAKNVERIIENTTGQMLEMKNPCLLLTGVDVSGEFHRFLAQHEYPFWRAVWLAPETEEDPRTEALEVSQ